MMESSKVRDAERAAAAADQEKTASGCVQWVVAARESPQVAIPKKPQFAGLGGEKPRKQRHQRIWLHKTHSLRWLSCAEPSMKGGLKDEEARRSARRGRLGGVGSGGGLRECEAADQWRQWRWLERPVHGEPGRPAGLLPERHEQGAIARAG